MIILVILIAAVLIGTIDSMIECFVTFSLFIGLILIFRKILSGIGFENNNINRLNHFSYKK